MKFQTLLLFSGYRMLALLLGKLLHGNRGLFLLFPVVLMGMFLGWSSTAYAGPANPEPTQITQPDGTTFQSIMRGDEFQGWMETTDGYTIVKNPTTGFFEYASHDAEGNLVPSGILITAPNAADLAAPGLLPPKGLRPPLKGLRPPPNTDLQLYKEDFLEAVRAQRTASGLSATPGQTGIWTPPTPVSGPKKILVILVNFLDASLSSGAATYWSNAVHDNTAGASSVFKYYQDNSFSHIAISPVTHTQPGSPTGVVTVTLAQSHPNCGSICSLSTESAWINSALAAAAPYVNFAALDTNHDGTITVDEALIYFVLAGYETSAGSGLTPSIWAHAWGGGGVTAGGKWVNHWALNGEMYNISTRMKMGVIAHEMGHAMGGLPDLYDINLVNQGLGIFSLMAGGSWGRKSGEIQGATPVGLDAWSRQYLGWSTPQSPVNGATFSFVSGLSSPSSALMLMNSTSSTSEYWLVENRPPVGWDAGMYLYLGTWTGGLLIQHIDLNVGTKSGNSFNKYVSGAHQGNMADEPSTALCSLGSIMASTRGCPTILYYSGNSTAFNPASTPSSLYYSSAASGLGVSGISPAGSTMSATVSVVTPVNYTLSVTKAGAGTGSVSSSPAVIVNCTTSCSASVGSGTVVTLTATSTGSGYFTGWSGACTGTGICSVTMSAARSVTATFVVGTVVTPINQTNRSGAPGSAQYFSVAVPTGARNLVIQTSGGTGDVDLYVQASTVPTLSVFDCRSWFYGNNETCTFPTPLVTTYHIMLFGYAAYSGVSLTVSYITALLPTAPTIGPAIPGNASISVAFTPGAIGDGSLISYWAGCTKDHVTYLSVAGSNSPINVTGLVNGSPYSCYAFTQSTVGWSLWSAYSNTVIPAAPPGAPTNITVTAYPGRLQVSFTAPVDTGGSTITGYTVTCTAAGQTTRTNTGASSPISVYGLTPGVAYSCTVTASNTAATSAPSTPVTSTALRIDLTPILMLLLDD